MLNSVFQWQVSEAIACLLSVFIGDVKVTFIFNPFIVEILAT